MVKFEDGVSDYLRMKLDASYKAIDLIAELDALVRDKIISPSTGKYYLDILS